MGCLHDLANVQQTSSKCIQNTPANAGRLLDSVNTYYCCYRLSAITCCCYYFLRSCTVLDAIIGPPVSQMNGLHFIHLEVNQPTNDEPAYI